MLKSILIAGAILAQVDSSSVAVPPKGIAAKATKIESKLENPRLVLTIAKPKLGTVVPVVIENAEHEPAIVIMSIGNSWEDYTQDGQGYEKSLVRPDLLISVPMFVGGLSAKPLRFVIPDEEFLVGRKIYAQLLGITTTSFARLESHPWEMTLGY